MTEIHEVSIIKVRLFQELLVNFIATYANCNSGLPFKEILETARVIFVHLVKLLKTFRLQATRSMRQLVSRSLYLPIRENRQTRNLDR